jgi:outer membrane protein assembly factor BamB
VPGSNGGALWEHGTVDPESGYLYVGSMTRPSLLALAKDPKHDIDFINVGGPMPTVFDLPIIKPPYGRITAIDMNRGQHVWQIPNGDTPREIRNHPMLKEVNIGRTGSPSKAGLLATKTLLFAGEGWGGQPYFRALDKRTGEIVWETRIPGVQTGTPMTYLHDGRQYVVFSAGDQDTATPGMLIAFALADTPDTTALSGWAPGGAAWKEEKGEISATAKGGPTYLRSTATYANVEVTGEFFADADVNSGIFVRCPASDTPAISQRTCYELNISDSHATYPTGSIVEVAAAPHMATAGRWNSFEFHVDGSHLVARVNGKVTVDARDDKLQGPGTVALQSSGTGTIRFRNVRIRALGDKKTTSH